MSDCNTILSINTSKGTTQAERSLNALANDYFKLEERSITDFIFYAQKLSEHLIFYNQQNVADGVWSPFFKTESIAILVYLSKLNVQFSTELEILKKEVALANNEIEKQEQASNFYTTLSNTLVTVSDGFVLLSDDIGVKEFYLGSTKTLLDLLASLSLQISGSGDITKTIYDFTFQKTGQSIDAIILQWKNRSLREIDYLLNNYASYKPHYALFLAFLKLLEYSITEVNTFTRRHLNFYYQDILKFTCKNAVADSVHLIVEPNTDIAFELPAQTIFPAKKNTAGLNKYYASVASQTFNNIQVKSLLSTNINNGIWYKNDLTTLNAAGSSFDFFQTEEEIKPALFLTHPILYMMGGERSIIIKINGTAINHLLYDYFITSEKEFKQIDAIYITKDRIILPPAEKSIVAYDPKIHAGLGIGTNMPVMKIVLKNGLEEFRIKKLSVRVEVINTKKMLVSTDTGIADIAKSFKPFGEFPANNNCMVMTCNEFFLKEGATLKWNIPESLKQVCKFEYLKGGVWNEIGKVSDAFFVDSGKFIFKNLTTSNEIMKDEVYNSSSSEGFIRLRLDDSKYEEQAFLNDYITKAKQATVDLPIAPVVEETSIDYYHEANLYLKAFNDKSGNNKEQPHIFVSTAFGYQWYGVPVMPAMGDIYVGLEKAEAKRSLSILFQMQDGSANPLNEPAVIHWYYLNNNAWIEFSAGDLMDDTLGLQQSGIVQFTIPDYSNERTTLLDPALFWLKITVTDLTGVCHVFGIHCQALKATFYDYEAAGNYYTEATPAQTIKEVFDAGSGVKKIKQPYVSFGGVLEEDEFRLNRRVSERLRHKERAITGWDYERLVLEKFPEVYKVKCLNHYQYDTKHVSAVAAGYTTLIVISQSSVAENPVEWKPMPSLALRKRIVAFLQPLMSSHVRLQVKPPVLEEIRVSCKVAYKLNAGDDAKLLADKLKEALNQFISPWAYSSKSVDFAGDIAYAKFIQLMDNLEYVDFVTEVKLFHDGVAVNEILPKTDYSLFIPSQQHLLTEIKGT